MNCLFFVMADQRKVFSLTSSRDHFQRSAPSCIFYAPRARFEPEQKTSSVFVEWSCALVITTTPRRQDSGVLPHHEPGSEENTLWRRENHPVTYRSEMQANYGLAKWLSIRSQTNYYLVRRNQRFLKNKNRT